MQMGCPGDKKPSGRFTGFDKLCLSPVIRSLLFILPVPQSLPGSSQTCLPVLCQHRLLSFSSGLRSTPEVLFVMIGGPLGEAGPFWELLYVS